MTFFRLHAPIFLILLAMTFLAFGFLLDTPLWDGQDATVLRDAHEASNHLGEMVRHVGFYFSQPLLQLVFLAEYQFFGLDPTGYLAVNLFIHAFNAFLVYMLINMLFARQGLAFLAAVLFALGVGNYGKIFMTIHQLESLLLATFHLLVLYVFIRNDFRNEGKITSPLFLAGLVLFLLAGLTKFASISLISCLIAYKLFFLRKRQMRAVLSADLLVILLIGVAFYIGQHLWTSRQPIVFGEGHSGLHYTLMSLKNIFRYLNLMFFPMQQSPILEDTASWVVWVFEARTVIRVFLTLSIISYSFFGFVFGNQTTRFFIAWTYITLLPFTGLTPSGNWLNLNHLYLTSLGFCFILASGTIGTSGLLARRRWRRFLPYCIPLAFIGISLGLSQKLDKRNNHAAARAEAVQLREDLAQTCRPPQEYFFQDP